MPYYPPRRGDRELTTSHQAPAQDPAAVEGPGVLTVDQRRRVEALRAARGVLVTRSLAGSGAADPMDTVTLARFIVTGEDPYGLSNQTPAS